MIAGIQRNRSVILTVIVLAALAVFVAACSDDGETATTGIGDSTATTADGSSDSTAKSPTDSTDASDSTTTTQTTAPVGKTLDDYRAEIPDLETAVEADPTDLLSLEKLAVAHFQLQEYEQAEAAYLKILAIQEDAFTRNNLGNVYRDWGKSEEAKAAYKQAIEEDPTLKYPYVNLSGVLRAEGDIEGALAILEEGAKHVGEEGQSIIEAAEERVTSTTGTTAAK